jgi:hypothetical protein
VALLSNLINSTSVLEDRLSAQAGASSSIATYLSCTNTGGYGGVSVVSPLVSASCPPAARTATPHRARRNTPRRRRIIVVGTLLGLAAVVVCVEFARDAVTPRLFDGAKSLTGGVAVGMAVAGWCTYGLLPLAAILLDRDHRRRYGRPDVGPLADSTVLMRRIKASDGHRLAPRSWYAWFWRVPSVVLIALAVVFLPIPGDGHRNLVDAMQATHGGAAFLIGWQWACVAAVLGVMFIVMGPVITALRPRGSDGRVRVESRRLPVGAYVTASALSLAALAVAIGSA